MIGVKRRRCVHLLFFICVLVAISSFSSSFTIPEEEEVGEGKKLRDNNQFEDLKERYGHRSSSDGNLIFYTIGDWGVRGIDGIDGGKNFPGSAQMAVAQQMKLLAENVQPQFVATLGDNFYGAGVGSLEDRQWDYKYEQVYLKNNSSLRSTRWFASLGDHDHCGNVQAQIDYHSAKNYLWHLGKAKTPYYHKEFRIGGGSSTSDSDNISDEMQLIVVDWVGLEGLLAGKEKRRFEDQLGAFASAEAGEEQFNWLKRVLERGHGKYRWRVVTAHRPIISASSRFAHDNVAYPGESSTREALRVLLENSDVDVYLNGHDHTAQHACTQRDDFNGKNKLTHYITNGIGGYELHHLVDNDKRPIETLDAKNTFHGFAMHSVTKDKFDTVFIGHDGKVELELSFDKTQQRCN